MSDSLRPQDILAIVIAVVGSIGFIFWGIGLSTIGTSTLRWLGGSIVAFVAFLVAFLSRWFK